MEKNSKLKFFIRIKRVRENEQSHYMNKFQILNNPINFGNIVLFILLFTIAFKRGFSGLSVVENILFVKIIENAHYLKVHAPKYRLKIIDKCDTIFIISQLWYQLEITPPSIVH